MSSILYYSHHTEAFTQLPYDRIASVFYFRARHILSGALCVNTSSTLIGKLPTCPSNILSLVHETILAIALECPSWSQLPIIAADWGKSYSIHYRCPIGTLAKFAA